MWQTVSSTDQYFLILSFYARMEKKQFWNPWKISYKMYKIFFPFSFSFSIENETPGNFWLRCLQSFFFFFFFFLCTGTREFGMCAPVEPRGYCDYGTTLEIRDIRYLPDGRSVLNTIGKRRFKVISRSDKDGYNTAIVEFLKVTDKIMCR